VKSQLKLSILLLKPLIMITSLGKPEREYICRVSVESPTVMANIIEHVTEYHVTKDLSIV